MSTSVPTHTKAISRPSGRVLPRAISGQEFVLIGVIVLLWALLGVFTPGFLQPASLQPLLASIAPIAIIGIGMTIIIITAGIDISVAGMVMVCSVVMAKLMAEGGVPLPVALPIGVAIGGLLGLLNGVLIAIGRVHPIIITFGTANIFLFIGLRIFDAQVVNGIPSSVGVFGRGEAGRLFGIPHSFLIMLVLAAIVWWFLRYTAGGRHFYAIGSDAPAAKLAGIRVERHTMIPYVLTGLLAGLASIIVIANGTQSLAPTVGKGMELQVIAAVVIGGTSILGGRGTVLGTVLGAILVQTVTSGTIQLGWPSQLANFFVGVAIVIAVGADLIQQRFRRKA
ncbi:ABC transporter permease [Leucobacter sp. CSA1]|uniref:ABC transporter permease n=1 Tax=Leucobacter chromiisoli TaxID=2796471 RepID=A0A934Q807_9MICO|nr:ABC transporter permease [Leucobacter chromiisoli]MBK0418359.1 ABC transporter permease [Leucobacter chromiisoli]